MFVDGSQEDSLVAGKSSRYDLIRGSVVQTSDERRKGCEISKERIFVVNCRVKTNDRDGS